MLQDSDNGNALIEPWTHKRHPIHHPQRQDMRCLLWLLWRKQTVWWLRREKENISHITDPLCDESTTHQWISPTKGQLCWALIFYLILALKSWWTNIWVAKMLMWHHCNVTSNGSWCMGIKGEMSGTVCVTFTWDIYIYELFIVFVFFLFVHYCNLMVCVVYWVGKWRSRGSTGMFGNLMAIYHIMLQFIQNHYKSTFS